MFQTRSEVQGINQHETLEEAFKHANKYKSVWKISFDAIDGTRIRLIRQSTPVGDRWAYQNIWGESGIDETS